MKIFISHSWKNKTQAQMIANYLQENGMDVWIDTNEIIPGQEIDDTISRDLKKVGLIVLLWSKEAAESDGVAQELIEAKALEKTIIPFCIDETSQEENEAIKNVKVIKVTDMREGMNRLLVVVTHYAMKEFNMQDTASGKSMVDFQGKIEAVNHLLHNEELKQKGSK